MGLPPVGLIYFNVCQNTRDWFLCQRQTPQVSSAQCCWALVKFGQFSLMFQDSNCKWWGVMLSGVVGFPKGWVCKGYELAQVVLFQKGLLHIVF